MKFTVEEPGRLDTLLAEQDAELSRSKIQKAIKEGQVTVNGTVTKKQAYMLSAGDEVSIQVDEAALRSQKPIEPIDQKLEVLYEDDACLVLNKPAGIAVHPGHAMDPNEETLLSGIAYLFIARDIPFTADAVLVHRLDKPTTGCIIVAKNYNSFTELQKQFAQRSTTKKYLAVVANVPEHKTATIDAPIGRNLSDRTRMSILKTSTSKDAVTDFEVLDSVADCALLECTLHTGRTHQIRVHLASIGHPILGDSTYGNTRSEKISQQYNVQELCLHARRIGFVSPADNKEHFVEAPLSPTVSQALEASGLSNPCS